MLSQYDIISSRFKGYKTQKPWGLTPWLSEPIFPLGMKQTRLREVFLSSLIFYRKITFCVVIVPLLVMVFTMYSP
jgi:hypothetical protein